MSKRTPSSEIPLPASFSGKNNFIVIKFSSSYIYDGPWSFGAYSSTLNFWKMLTFTRKKIMILSEIQKIKVSAIVELSVFWPPDTQEELELCLGSQ